MDTENEYIRVLMADREMSLNSLLPYLPWLLNAAGKAGSTIFNGEGIGESSVGFPVYDGTLMNFIKAATATPMMDRNYLYVYTRHDIKDHSKERELIEKATWREWDILCGILSYYVLGGRTRGILWNEGLESGIFTLVVSKMKEIVDFWKTTER